MTLRLARAGAEHQAAVERIRPELESIKKRFASNPRRLAEETRRLFERERVPMVSPAGCLGALVQLPVFLAMYAAVGKVAAVGGRLLWIRDLSMPDRILALIVAGLTAASMAAGSAPELSTQQRVLMLVMPAVLTAIALWHMAAGIRLYWGVSSATAIAQGLIVRRLAPRR